MYDRHVHGQRSLLLDILTDETKKWWSIACRLYDLSAFDGLPIISLDLRGVCAGKASILKIWYNPKIAENNLEDFLVRTVPHEVAHTVDRRLHGTSSHGPAWKRIMRDFGVDDSRCHSYTAGVTPARRIARFQYDCGCPEPHFLTSIRHKRVLQGKFYHCGACGSCLVRSVR